MNKKIGYNPIGFGSKGDELGSYKWKNRCWRRVALLKGSNPTHDQATEVTECSDIYILKERITKQDLSFSKESHHGGTR